MANGPGQFYEWLTQAVKRGGSQRTLYTPETTLSRRGLLTRADKRARELTSLGLKAGDVLAVSLGNVVEYFVMLMGASKLGVIILPVDPANGDRTLVDAMRRIPVRAVIRRQRGLEAAPLQYPRSYALKSRRQLSATMVAADVLDRPGSLRPGPRADVELIVEATGPDGVQRYVHRTGPQIAAIGHAAAAALALEEKWRLVCVESLTEPAFFDPVVLGWLASDAQLVVTSGPDLGEGLALAHGGHKTIVFASRPVFSALGRSLAVRNESLDLTPVLPDIGSTARFARTCRQRFSNPPRELIAQEEVGIIGVNDKSLSAAEGIEARPGETIDDRVELAIRSTQCGELWPAPPQDVTGAVDADGFVRTGLTAQFTKSGVLKEVVGRRDGLARIEGRRASLGQIADAMTAHRRVTWARAQVEPDADGEPALRLSYVATGQTEVEDIEEHAVGQLPPYLVPHEFIRLEQPE